MHVDVHIISCWTEANVTSAKVMDTVCIPNKPSVSQSCTSYSYNVANIVTESCKHSTTELLSF